MKIAKMMLLALGLMALTVAASFGAAGFDAQAGPRIISNTSETGETQTVILTATHGDSVFPATIPDEHSMYFLYNMPISHLGDISVHMNLPNGRYADSVGGPITAYSTHILDIEDDLGVKIAEMRVGWTPTDYARVEIHFTEEVSFYQGNTIELRGVRVDVSSLHPLVNQEVTVSIMNSEGEVSITNWKDLVVAITAEPIYCDGCYETVSFRSDGMTLNQYATFTVGELFPNAFEVPSKLLVNITGIPTGYSFEGVAGIVGVDPSGSPEPTATSSNWVTGTGSGSFVLNIASQNESHLEYFEVGLIFDLVSTPDFDPSDATIAVSLYPSHSSASPPEGAYPYGKLRYLYNAVYCSVSFEFEEELGGRLLSVFNTSGAVWDTGLAVMNGSGAEPLSGYRAWMGSWWNIPQYGTVTFYIYPQDTAVNDNDASPFIYTTGPGSPGLGLDAYGRVPPKGTYTVLVSQLLPLAPSLGVPANPVHTGEFTGFIVVETNFPLAEGVSYVTDWFTQAQGYPMINLIIRDPEFFDNWGWPVFD